ncbi:MAG: murein biosynthesis integral membrane protein MurJ [Rhodovarius sp.]|nr:murein biosynthesis integral membrane protein MurJ [Rhodovarius sp.]
MLRHVATVGGWTMASRILGFARDMLIAAKLGAGPLADAFFVALKLPNLFRRLFGEGAFNAAFVPAFTAALTRSGQAAAQQLAMRLGSLLALWLALLTGLGLVFAPQVLLVLAPGFPARGAEHFALAVELTRITLPYLLFICLAALLSGVLNGMGRFAAAAAAPVFFNLLAMAALLFLTPYVATPAHALSWGVSASGLVQLGLVWFAAARAGLALRPALPRIGAEEAAVLRRMAPGILGAGVTQLNLAVDVIIASLLPPGGLSLLYYADRVAQLPLGVIGAAIGTALLPTLSAQLAAGRRLRAQQSFNRALEISLALSLPSALALIALALPIMTVLFQRGAFTAADAAGGAEVLVAYACGLPAFILVKALAPGFFARGDTRTPVVIGIGCVVLNLCLNLFFLWATALGAPGIALATSLSAWVQAGLLALLLRRRRLWLPDRRLRRAAPRLAGAAVLMALLLVLLDRLWPAGPGWAGVPVLAASCAAGLLAYASALQALRALDLREAWRHLRRRPRVPPTPA